MTIQCFGSLQMFHHCLCSAFKLGLLLAAFCHASGPGVVAEDETTLMWSNGDALTGELVGADASSLTWRSPLFTDPLQIQLQALSSVSFPKSEDVPQDKDAYRILMRNGDVLFGTLKGMTDTTFLFESPRFGAFEVAQTQVLSVQRSSNSGGVIYSGPRGLEGWQPAFRRSAQQNNARAVFRGNMAVRPDAAPEGEAQDKIKAAAMLSAWTEMADGSISITKTDGALFLPLELPDLYEVELEVASKKQLAFVLAFGRDTKDGLRLHAWFDVLVAAHKSTFTTLQEIPEKASELHVHMFVNQKTKKMLVVSHNGARLGEIEILGLIRGGVEGLTLRNSEGDLTLKKLRISNWDGSEPRISSGKHTRIQMADGSVHEGTLGSVNAETKLLAIQESEGSVEVPLDQVASIVLQSESGEQAPRGSTQITWNDGGYVSGTLKTIADGKALLQTLYSSEPLQCQLANAAKLSLTSGQIETTQTDRLFHSGRTLQGSLVVDGRQDAPIQWRPLGGLTSSTLRGGHSARFVRGAQVRHFSETPEMLVNFPDVLYLKNNDVLPCHFEGFSEESITLTTPFSETRSFPRDQVRAVELGATGRIHQKGFGAEGWKGISARIKDRESLSLQSNNNYSHPDILTGDTVRFRLKWPVQSYATLNLSLFGTGNRKDEMATHLCFQIMQASLQITDKPQNQMMFQGMRGQNTQDIIRVPGCDIAVELVAKDGNLIVKIDEKQVKSFKLNPAGAGMKGFSFSANVQMMRHNVVNGRVQENDDSSFQISEFEVDNLSGASVRQFIDEEVRLAALTVPRFRRDSPPTHVLIASNGDLLRGRLKTIGEQHVNFESRLENIRIDRSRIAAIVWLDPVAKDSDGKGSAPKDAPPVKDTANNQAVSDQNAAAPVEVPATEETQDAFVMNDEIDDAAMQAQLADGFSITMTPASLVDGQILGESPLLGKCTFPASSIRELCLGNPADREVSAAYEQWVARNAPEPDWDIASSDGGNSAGSKMIGTVAEDFQLSLLDGTNFRLKDHADKIIVLDFWATWCGPCVAALPDYIAATSHFESSQVIFVAVNQQESPDQIRGFLEEKNLSPQVALDRNGAVGQKFQVSGIPHTVIIGPGNVIEDVHVGYQAGGGEHMQISIQQMLDGTWKRPEAASGNPEQQPAKEPEAI